MPGARWFEGATLSFTANLLRRSAAATRSCSRTSAASAASSRGRSSRAQVAGVAAGLRALGVGRGDRVAGFLPNLPEAVVAMLAAATPRRRLVVVLAGLRRRRRARPLRADRAEGAVRGGRLLLQRQEHRLAASSSARSPRGCRAARESSWSRIWTARPTLRGAAERGCCSPTCSTPRRDSSSSSRCRSTIRSTSSIPSGTTGVPKCIVHGAGGTLLQHLQGARAAHRRPAGRPRLLLHHLRLDDVELARVGARVGRDARALRRLAVPSRPARALATRRARADHDLRHLARKFIDALEKAGLAPRATRTTSARCAAMLSTGSPLAPESFDYVYDAASRPTCSSSSISGGTDIVSCFALGNPTLPVWRGEIQCRGLGMAVDVFDEDGRPVRGAEGRARLHGAVSVDAGRLLERSGRARAIAPPTSTRFPDVWCHGDYAELTEHDGIDHLRPLGRDAQSRRRAHRHRGDLSPGRAARRRSSRALVVGQDWRRRRARRAVRAAAAGRDARRSARARRSATRSARTRPRATCRRRSSP